MRNNLIKILRSVFVIAVAIPMISLADNRSNKDEEVSDTWLQAKLVTTYAFNNNLSIFDIDVDVRDQVAYLGGVVDSDVKKDLAGEIAKSIDGVKDVKNNISVDAAKSTAHKTKASKNSERSFSQVVDDLTTTASIKTKLLADSNVSGLDINVDTMNNRVTLNGVVRSDAERQLVEQIASNTSGVKDVSNKLAIKPNKS